MVCFLLVLTNYFFVRIGVLVFTEPVSSGRISEPDHVYCLYLLVCSAPPVNCVMLGPVYVYYVDISPPVFSLLCFLCLSLSESTEVLAGRCQHCGVEEEVRPVPAASHQVSPGQGGQGGRHGGGEEGGRGGQAGGQHVRVTGPSQAVRIVFLCFVVVCVVHDAAKGEGLHEGCHLRDSQQGTARHQRAGQETRLPRRAAGQQGERRRLLYCPTASRKTH